MITTYSPESFNKVLGYYIDIHEKDGASFLCSLGDADWFFGEMMYRFLTKRIAIEDMVGPGDLSLLSLRPTEDYNAGAIAYASAQTVKAHRYRDYDKQVEDRILKPLQTLFPANSQKPRVYSGDLLYLALQEQAGLILVNLYLRGGDYSTSSSPLFARLDHAKWLRNAVLSSWNGSDGSDWKDMRCLIYRYLMYCGFVGVDKDCNIDIEHIPQLQVLTRIIARFTDITNMRADWGQAGLTESVDEVLNPEVIAKHFLRFNGVAVQ